MTADCWRSGVARSLLQRRARLWADIRAFMAEQGLLEVDTPLLAAAAPSERGLACLSVPDYGYLVPSPEHALKRLLAEGAGSLYQLSHVFRAGEIGRWHNPEFTMLEWYGVGDSMTQAVRRLAALLQYLGAPEPAPWLTYRQAFLWHAGLDPLQASTTQLAELAMAREVAPIGMSAVDEDRVFWLDLLMATCVQPELGRERPQMVTHFPIDDAVLVATDPQDARQALRFECFWQGVELANGASELQDAQLAQQRMTREQQARRQQGAAVPPMDDRLLAALSAGLPACAGVAVGVDRLLALLTGQDGLASVLPFAYQAWPGSELAYDGPVDMERSS